MPYQIGQVIGSLYFIIIPGLALSYLFFDPQTVGPVERLSYSFALSVSLVSLNLLLAGLLRLELSNSLILTFILIEIIIVGFFLVYKWKFNK